MVIREFSQKLSFRSTDSVGGEVKFDIWEEAELGEETSAAGDNCDDDNDMTDGCDLEAAGHKDEFDDNLGYTQHPLVVIQLKIS